MIDDDVITRLVELHDHIKAPDTPAGADVLRGERMLRRRRTVVGGAAVAAVMAVLGVTAVTTNGLQAGDRIEPIQPGPTQGPTPTTTDSPDEWPLERIRAEGSLVDEMVTESGITAREYLVCDGLPSECSTTVDGPIRRAHEHMALEVTQYGRSALFRISHQNGNWSVTALDDDSVFVMDDPRETWDPHQLRYRLLRANGTEVLLELVTDPAPAIPSPGVIVVDYSQSADPETHQHAFLVEEREGTLRPLDVPRVGVLGGPADLGTVGRYWGPNVEEFLWFVSPDCWVSWADGGTYEERRLDCADGFEFSWAGGDFTYVHGDWFPEGWLKPGRMALLENTDDRLILHVSLDQGATWQRIPVSAEDAIPDALRQLG